jgi:hypothetical protein
MPEIAVFADVNLWRLDDLIESHRGRFTQSGNLMKIQCFSRSFAAEFSVHRRMPWSHSLDKSRLQFQRAIQAPSCLIVLPKRGLILNNDFSAGGLNGKSDLGAGLGEHQVGRVLTSALLLTSCSDPWGGDPCGHRLMLRAV